MKNRFLIAKGKNLRFGPDIGDLSEAENYERFKKEICKATAKLKPDLTICDLHPGYLSTRLSKTFGSKPVQHHYAHIASVIEEHKLKRPVIGISFDGTGLGTDGNIWGGEFLLVDKKGFKRVAHLKYCKMPGGGKAIREPWRMVLSILGKRGVPFLKNIKKENKTLILSICKKNINSPLTSSAGRLFDAAAALIGICTHATYEAEGPIKLEKMTKTGIEKSYEFEILKENGSCIIDTKPVFLGMARDLKRKINKAIIATKFHNTMTNLIVETAKKISKKTGIRKIALSGGVFQNRFLRENVIKKLRFLKFNVFINENTPVNDLNISLGQYYVSGSTSKD